MLQLGIAHTRNSCYYIIDYLCLWQPDGMNHKHLAVIGASDQ